MYYYSQVNCKIIGETKTDVKAVIDYIQEKAHRSILSS